VSEDAFHEFEPIIDAAELRDAELASKDRESARPWRHVQGKLVYGPRLDVLVELLSGPITRGELSQTGRLAKALDAWLAYELRRAGFEPAEVWPRNASPRVYSREMAAVQEKLDRLAAWLAKQDAEADRMAKRAEDKGDLVAIADAADRLLKLNTRERAINVRRELAHEKKMAKYKAGEVKTEPKPLELLPLTTERVPSKHTLMPGLRDVLNAAIGAVPATNSTNILGRFYVKQVDVVVAAWDRGPDVLISGKTMFSSFGNNAKNRYEETLGEATNLRERYPMAGMAYAFVVDDAILKERGAYGRLQDLLLRTRKPHGPYDATMMLIVSEGGEGSAPIEIRDPLTHPETAGQNPPVDLSAERFFTDLLNAVLENTPEGKHDGVRTLRNGAPVPGGEVDLEADAEAEARAEAEDTA
jgi:hypothetical protein